MNLELIKTISAVSLPVVLLIVGIIINRKLEKRKVGLAKEKDWEMKWADEFFLLAKELNTCVSEIVCNLSFLAEEKAEEKFRNEWTEVIKLRIYRIRSIEWDIQNFAQFAGDAGSELNKVQSQLIEELNEILRNKKGDLEKLRVTQFVYNEIVRAAHKEILNLNK